VYIDDFGWIIAVQMLNRRQRFCSPGVGDANTGQQRRKRCENSNLEKTVLSTDGISFSSDLSRFGTLRLEIVVSFLTD
jgi:hypothetical protein